MRKFFALALAVAMVLSLASVSFAAENKDAVVDLEGPYRYKSDENQMVRPGGYDSGDMLRYGSGVYYLIEIDDAVAGAANETAAVAVQAYKEVEKLKAKAEFEMGEELVESVSIVKKYVDKASSADSANYVNGNGYYYFVEIKIAAKETTSEADIIGTIEFNRKADKKVTPASETTDTGLGKIKDDEEDVQFTVFYADSYVSDKDEFTFDGTDDQLWLKYDTNYALKFDDDEEIELEFGDSNNNGTNEGTFTVDVSGQGKVFLKYNTKANDAICDANPGVEMFFVNFNNAKFNRVGEFVYEMDDMVAAYKVVGDQLVEIKGAEFDTDSVTFYTRALESYVFATAELVNPAAAVEAPVVEAPAVTNPSTGA